jgi:hypothetical protein
MNSPIILLAYFSPETVLPLASILATIVGAAMFCTRGTVRFVVRCFRGAIRRPRRAAQVHAPHFDSGRARVAEETRE